MSIVVYNIPPTHNFSGNPIRFKVGTNTPIATVGLYIQCRVLFATMGNTPVEIIRFPLTPNALGLAEVDVQRILDKLMDFSLPQPTTAVQQVSTHAGTLQVLFSEYSINDPLGTTPVDAGTFTVLKGGIAYQVWQGPAWFANVYPTRKFLSWFNTGRTISTWQHLWLSYLHLGADATGYTVRMIVYFTDGTNALGPVLNFPNSGAALQNRVYHIPVGYTQQSIGAVDPTKVVHYYTVQVFEAASPVSEEITCTMDYTPDYRQVQFVFFNSLSGIDTLVLEGEQKETFTREFDLVDVNTSRQNFAGSILPAQSAMNRILEQQTFKGNIGLTDDQQLQDIRRELFLSRAIYTLKGGRWIPVNIVNKDVETGEMIAQLRELSIDWSYAYASEKYTPGWMDLGSLPSPGVACPTATITKSASLATIAFSHQPSPYDRYRVQCFKTSTDEQVGATQTFNIPFGTTLSATFSGLEAETDYYFVILMDILATDQTQTCTGYTVTTDAAVDPGEPPPDTYGNIIIDLIGPSYSEMAITSLTSPVAEVELTYPDMYPLTTSPVTGTTTPVTGTHHAGTYDLFISFNGMMGNTATLVDASGLEQEQTISYSGLITFTNVFIDAAGPVYITIE